MNTRDQANAYSGHAKNGSPIQKHSQSDFYARYKIIMVFMPVRMILMIVMMVMPVLEQPRRGKVD